jgi:hypothetical protein
VEIKNALKILMPRPIIRSIAQMNAAVLPLIKELWRSITKRRLLEMAHIVVVRSVA